MNIILSIQRVHLVKNNERKAFRRVLNVSEIADYKDYKDIFEWHPSADEYLSSFNKSVLLSAISGRVGSSRKELLDEIKRRKDVLHWMKERNIRSYKDVAAIIAEYYARPKQIYGKILAGEEVKAIAVSRNT
jgi:flagellar protein FlaI